MGYRSVRPRKKIKLKSENSPSEYLKTSELATKDSLELFIFNHHVLENNLSIFSQTCTLCHPLIINYTLQHGIEIHCIQF